MGCELYKRRGQKHSSQPSKRTWKMPRLQAGSLSRKHAAMCEHLALSPRWSGVHGLAATFVLATSLVILIWFTLRAAGEVIATGLVGKA